MFREISEWVLCAGGRSFSDADEFIQNRRANAATVITKRAVIGTSLEGHIEVKIWALKTCIDKLLHLFPYCYRDEILREKLTYFARTCRITNISKTESRHRAITSGSAKGKWRKRHCIRISGNVIDPLDDTRLPHEGGYMMSPMGFINYITDLRAKKLEERKTEEPSNDV
ncbi:hypothetical protein I302_101304 [Kwoniella bestiolae CBS 10118]|uniref:Uncharacterized protein n=1 Tax=Kwoniella bestiolae CBS 10118 TaxID=1296100 RepID=A0A1B9G7J0_9TREE|nr:hypothetical protein I302_04678 [Kwoniella bestiolae CBS 10118]OCF26986.1 hypothetical protein I302_04678 [Kwoniella bestiolae CBS 10118]